MMQDRIFMEAELILRIAAAALCGGVIGYERQNRGKGAGIRTHVIVAVAATLMMIVSQYGFYDFFAGEKAVGVDIRLDPSRIASQIVSGIGFLGAGVIFVQKKTVLGLTTAAGVWATAGIGMAIGGGMYFLAIACTLLIFLFQILLHKKLWVMRTLMEESMTITIHDDEQSMQILKNIIEEQCLSMKVASFERVDGMLKLTILISRKTNEEIDTDEVLELLMKSPAVTSVRT